MGEAEAKAVSALGTEVTVIDTEVLFWVFWLSFTVRIARKLPGEEYVWVAFCAVEVPPSPKFQL